MSLMYINSHILNKIRTTQVKEMKFVVIHTLLTYYMADVSLCFHKIRILKIWYTIIIQLLNQ
jgi:hypothetical protein